MRGRPVVLATKQDVLNGIATYPAETKQALRAMIADRYIFVPTGELAEGEDGVTDDTHRVETREEERDGEMVTVRTQYEKIEDKNAQIFRLGFTLKEAQGLAR